LITELGRGDPKPHFHVFGPRPFCRLLATTTTGWMKGSQPLRILALPSRRDKEAACPTCYGPLRYSLVAKPSSARKHKDASGLEVVAQNRAASYNYHLLEKMEAGMALRGTEVKALRAGKANLRDAYAEVRGTSVWLVNCHIPQYQPGGPFNHEPLSRRRLLLHKQEIARLFGKTQQKGLTLVPLRIYFRNGIAKCELALARGKKDWDRRQAEREKETRREVNEALFKYRRR
jgi:SsrA-binding protein